MPLLLLPVNRRVKGVGFMAVHSVFRCVAKWKKGLLTLVWVRGGGGCQAVCYHVGGVGMGVCWWCQCGRADVGVVVAVVVLVVNEGRDSLWPPMRCRWLVAAVDVLAKHRSFCFSGPPAVTIGALLRSIYFLAVPPSASGLCLHVADTETTRSLANSQQSSTP